MTKERAIGGRVGRGRDTDFMQIRTPPSPSFSFKGSRQRVSPYPFIPRPLPTLSYLHLLRERIGVRQKLGYSSKHTNLSMNVNHKNLFSPIHKIERNNIQGWPKRWTQSSVNLREKSCVLLPAAVRRTQLFSPHIHRTWNPPFRPSLY